MPNYFDWNVRKILLSLISIFLIAVFWVWLTSPMVVVVSGIGEVSVPASNAVVSFSLSSNNSSSQEAVANVNAKALAMREFLKTKGVAEGDIAEGQITVVPASLVVAGSSGYQASISMAAKTVHVSDISTLVSDLYGNGALVVSQPVLSVENQDKLEAQAFTLAMNDAKKEVSTIGLQNWKFIRKIVGISQSQSSNTSTATTKADTVTATQNATASENGVFKIVKSVTVSYKLW